MKIRKFIVAAMMLFAAAPAVLAQDMAVPNDTAVRTGKLANGLTYYVRQNNYPENRVNFYIAQRVGSIQEEESQRGLAHFLEHMAFNGSEHFNGAFPHPRAGTPPHRRAQRVAAPAATEAKLRRVFLESAR